MCWFLVANTFSRETYPVPTLSCPNYYRLEGDESEITMCTSCSGFQELCEFHPTKQGTQIVSTPINSLRRFSVFLPARGVILHGNGSGVLIKTSMIRKR